jgi:hypothetical protein
VAPARHGGRPGPGLVSCQVMSVASQAERSPFLARTQDRDNAGGMARSEDAVRGGERPPERDGRRLARH